MLNTQRSFSYFREENRPRVDFSKLSYEELIDSGYLIAGSPDSVARQLRQQMQQVGAGHFMGMFHIGNLAHRLVIDSLDRFHVYVMPQVQD